MTLFKEQRLSRNGGVSTLLIGEDVTPAVTIHNAYGIMGWRLLARIGVMAPESDVANKEFDELIVLRAGMYGARKISMALAGGEPPYSSSETVREYTAAVVGNRYLSALAVTLNGHPSEEELVEAGQFLPPATDVYLEHGNGYVEENVVSLVPTEAGLVAVSALSDTTLRIQFAVPSSQPATASS